MSDNVFDFKGYLSERRRRINQSLETILTSHGLERELIRAMHHSLMAGGKRLRPILCMAACQAASGDDTPAMPAACALEMVHTYSLIHDDLPAMDDDDLRRGIPTCHKAFSEATAILAGDGLLTYAFELLAEPGRFFDIRLSSDVRLDLIRILAEAAGISGMIEGQMMDMFHEGAVPELAPEGLQRLETMHYLKTGRMIIASVEAGAACGNATPEFRQGLLQYARSIGLAFQVKDDILNVEGDPAVMGKAAGSDAEHQKMTFPALLGLDESRHYAKKLINDAVRSLESVNITQGPLLAIADYILKRHR